jgi:hypothetical protein
LDDGAIFITLTVFWVYKKKFWGFFLGRDQDARTTLRWLRLDYVYLPKNSQKKSVSTLNNSATVFCKNLKMISRGPAYNVEPEIKDMESVLSIVPQEKISCK